MKTVIKVFTSILIVVLCNQCKKTDSVVTINDANFLSTLIHQGVDKNGDGNISPAEAEMVTSLNLMMASISDMEGMKIIFAFR